MVDEIAVDGKPVLVLPQVYPLRFNVDGTVTLLEEDNVRYHFRTGVCLKSVVRQTDRAQQLRPFRDVLAYFGGLLIHGVAGGHKSNHAARTHLVERFGEKVIVNRKTELVISPVIYLILSERHIADGKVEEVAPVCGFKTRYGDVGLGIKLLCNASGDAVQLHAVQAAVSHFLREKPEEVAHTHRWFQNVAGLEAHIANRFINRLDNGGAGIVSVQGGSSCRFIFLRGQQFFQFGVFVAPVFLCGVKGICKTAPAHITGQHFLLFRDCLSAIRFQRFQQLNGIDVRLILGFCAAHAQVIVRDMEVLCVPADLRLGFLIHGFLGSGGVGEGAPLAINPNRYGISVQHFLKIGFPVSGNGLCRRVMFRFLHTQPLYHNVIGEIVFLAGIKCHGFGGDLRLSCFSYFRCEQMRVSLIPADVVLKHFPVDAFMAPAIRAGVNPHINLPDVADSPLDVAVRVRHDHGIAHFVGRNALQRDRLP